MNDEEKTTEQLLDELKVLRQRIAVLEAAETERTQADETQRYQAELLQHVSDAIIATDMNFVIRSWNAAAEKMYGWEAHDVLGKPLAEIVRPEYPYEPRDVVLRTFSKTGHYEGEVVHHRKDGTPLIIRGAVSMLKDREGNPTGRWRSTVTSATANGRRRRCEESGTERSDIWILLK